MTKFLNISVDDTLGGASPSDETVSSQKAIKTYIDNNAGVLPPQTGNSGKFLSTNGTTTSWQDALKPNQSITGATKTKITYDSNGLVTSGTDLSLLDIAEAGNNISIVNSSVSIQDFDKTGNPTITNDTISGLNYTNYISSPGYIPSSGIYKFIINCNFVRNTTYPAYVQPIVSNLTNNYGLFINPSNDSSRPNSLSFYDEANTVIHGTTNLTNGKYWIGLVFNSYTMTVSGYQMPDIGTYDRDTLPDFSNSVWIQEFNGTILADKFSGNKIKLGSNGNVSYLYWVGSIYLPYTYVEVNGNSFWDPILATEKAIISSTAASLPSQTGNAGKFLTTDGTNASWATVDASTVGALPNTTTANDIGGANKYLSNLTSTGKNISNWSSNVSNCITEIPQDINLTLSSGTLTLKAGSKVCVPNGSGVFNVLTINSDLTISGGIANADCFLFVTPNNTLQIREVSISESGTSSTLTGQYRAWYDTTNNSIKFTDNTGTTWTGGYSFPLAVISCSSSSISGIDDIFNGFGYIGSTIFALPGVKGLVPNGRNADGSLNSTLFTSSILKTITVTGTHNDWDIVLNASNIWAGVYTYNNEKNQNYSSSGNPVGRCHVAKYSVNNGSIVSLNAKKVFHAVDYSDFMNTVGDIETLLAQV